MSTYVQGVFYPTPNRSFGIARSRQDLISPGGIGESIARPLLGAFGVTALTSGTMRIQLHAFASGEIVTNIGFVTGTTAAVTPSHWWVALYNSALNLLAQSADQGAAAIAATTDIVLPLSSPQTIPLDGYYYLALMVVAATMPTMASNGNTDGTVLPSTIAPAGWGNSTAGLTTTAPAAAAAPTPDVHPIYIYPS